MAQEGLYLGLMSGTSIDGIDAALVTISASRIRLIHALTAPWPDGLADAIRDLLTRDSVSLAALGALDAQLGEAFAGAAWAACHAAGVAMTEVTAIGSHGQTLHHQPTGPAPFTLQIGDPNRLAERTGRPVVADLRRRDIAAGGQGAPLVPAFHHALFRQPTQGRLILNIGGIANLTALPPATLSEAPVLGFDTGPGNCLMDRWIHQHQGQPLDRDGAWAASAAPDAGLLTQLLADPYFALPPPKSTGTEYFSPAWLQRTLSARQAIPPKVVQATLAQLTVHSIAQAVEARGGAAHELLVCGGGVHNRHLMAQLAAALPHTHVRSTAELGVDPDALEAMAFAWLAHRRLAGLPGNLPSVTGASRPVILGAIYPGAG